ncbi:Os09g0323900 [Oryza sativa Japonica Group]|jgi:peroxidase|uniref:Os09g0323900 protein n=1 Tax=Oryza sativa subsp. japonica TaxID=39947 RepID=A0A0N7KQK4_ORYSJ|nr:Os09g0323900 [Oryza sativa Japonica Group]
MAIMTRVATAALMVAAAVLLGLAGAGHAQLQNGFYKGKCGANDVEAVVQGIVRSRFARDAPIVAYLLRMQFHECAVNVRGAQHSCSDDWCDRG